MWPLIPSMVLVLLSQLQIFWQLCLLKLLGLLISLRLLELYHLIYLRFSIWFGLLVCFANLSLMEFQVRCLALFCLFSVIESFEWFWIGSLCKNLQLSSWCSSKLYSWLYTFPTLHRWPYPDNVICNFAIYSYDTTLYSEYGQSPDLWQQLELNRTVFLF